ncbi:MAG: M20/M25/M40 family metallo-hydrolase [Candidatus Latescibacterota bacterium]|nr:M20/M25/M40 family metallo-hydrolase [Candidatus Latescibacterota bacterium]
MNNSNDPDAFERIRSFIDPKWIATTAKELVDIPSVTMDEAAVCSCFENKLRELGLHVDVREVTTDRNNLYARIPGNGNGPRLIFNGHLDTIPTGDHTPPYLDGDRLYGRGATDMKGGMASMLGAAKALIESDIKLNGDLWLTAVVGHEEVEAEKDGPKAFIDDVNSGRVYGDRILIVEGRDALWVMSMGSLVFSIKLKSSKGGMHTQYVPFKENPINFIGRIISDIRELQKDLDIHRIHRLAGAERIDVGMVQAGDYFNRTPVECRLTGTRRWMADKSARDILREITLLVQKACDNEDIEIDVKMDHEREPFEISADDAAVKAVAAAHKLVTNEDADYVGMRIVGDANLYVHGCGLPTFYYGPSNETAHADVEWVSIDRLTSAASVYAIAATHYCT